MEDRSRPKATGQVRRQAFRGHGRPLHCRRSFASFAYSSGSGVRCQSASSRHLRIARPSLRDAFCDPAEGGSEHQQLAEVLALMAVSVGKAKDLGWLSKEFFVIATDPLYDPYEFETLPKNLVKDGAEHNKWLKRSGRR